MEKEFYTDQLGERKMEIGPIDLVEERKKKKLEVRQKEVEKQIEKEKKRSHQRGYT